MKTDQGEGCSDEILMAQRSKELGFLYATLTLSFSSPGGEQPWGAVNGKEGFLYYSFRPQGWEEHTE